MESIFILARSASFPRVFGYESGTNLYIPQFLGHIPWVLRASPGSKLEISILTSSWELVPNTLHLSLSSGTLILCISQLQLCNKLPQTDELD